MVVPERSAGLIPAANRENLQSRRESFSDKRVDMPETVSGPISGGVAVADPVGASGAAVAVAPVDPATPPSAVPAGEAGPLRIDRRGQPRIGILVVAYNAESHLRSVLHRIPRDIVEKIDEIFIFDDASQDNTTDVGKAVKEELPHANINVYKNPVNLMYGGNQARGYMYAMERGLDIVVLLHGDGQYAPEVMQALLTPLERGEADMVMGSRMMVKGAALRGNMPMYKYLGNKVLTFIENALIGTRFTEFHSGYRAYSVRALQQLPLGRLTYNWHFDTQIIIEFVKKGFRVNEVPIPTYYGDEICHVNGIPYALHCMWEALTYAVLYRWKTQRGARVSGGGGSRGTGSRGRAERWNKHGPLPSSPRSEEQPPADFEARPGPAA
jgi:glycosyltransferase involved in cell wall biosynthesis